MNKILFIAGLVVVLMSGGALSFAQTATQGVSTDAAIPITSVSSVAPVEKCGVNTFQANDQCSDKSFRSAYFQCYDGYEEKQSDNSCKSSEEWQEYGKKICASRCAVVKPMPMPAPMPVPAPIPTVAKPVPAVSTCNLNETSMREYDQLVIQLRKAEAAGDKQLAQEITDKIISLKREIAKNQEGCKTGSATPIPIAEPAKPTVVGSGSGVGIDSYYRQKLQKVMSANDGAEKQIESLKILRSEIDSMIEKMIAGRTEFNASEVSGLVSEVKVLPGEIKANEISVKTTDKKIKIDVGAKELSIEPKEKEVIVNDGEINVKAEAVSIKDNVLSVGNSEVKLSPSEVINKLQLAPKVMELKEENSVAVYKMKIDEKRKLFGFIPITIEKSVNADAANGNVVSETRPWWSFLSTK